MATTNIHPITQTVALSIDYIMGDKKETVLKDDIADSIKYVMDDKTGEVIYYTLTSTLNCTSTDNPKEDFYELINTFGADEVKNGSTKTKDGKPILAWHLIQSFDPNVDGDVDPRVANEIGRKLAERLFPNFPVVISTHTNEAHIHNHIEFCAWNLDGKKYNYDHAAYDRIREESDKLCREYGLSVLEHTKERKLVRWEDAEGKVHYFEPTDRKIEKIRQREEGIISPDDVNSYRNTIPYQEDVAKKQTNVQIVKQAIDNVLPYATSYEHLLAMLREQGFLIKDRKKNGDWREHITFQPPTADKGVRDYKISEDGYYTRESLTAVIQSQVAERRRSEALQAHLQLPYYDEYVYGRIDIQGINEDYRAERTEDGGIKIVQRGEAERSVIRDVKRSDRELYGLIDTTQLDRLIAEQKEAQKRKASPRRREEVLIRQIQESFENLRFMEKKQIYSYTQINKIVEGLWDQYNKCLSEINKAEEMVGRLERAAQAPELALAVKKRIEQGQNDPAYMMEKYPSDVKLLKQYTDIMKKYNITDKESLKNLQTTVQKYRDQTTRLQGMLGAFNAELAAYNRCVATLARIDREQGRGKNEFLLHYETIVAKGREEALHKQEKKRGKGYGE